MANIWTPYLASLSKTANNSDRKKKKKKEEEQQAEVIVPKKQPVASVASTPKVGEQNNTPIDGSLLKNIANTQRNAAVFGAFESSGPFKVSKKPDVSALVDPKTGLPKDYADMKTGDVFKMVYQLPKEQREQVKSAIVSTYMDNPGYPSFFYPYYSKGSNKKADVAIWGTDDLDKVRKDPANQPLLGVLERNKSGESFRAPKKSDSALYKKAYSYQYLLQDGAEEDAVRAEVPALNAEVAQLAIDNPDASPEEVIKMVDWDKTGEDGEKLFKNIKSWRDETQYGGQKNTVAGGLYIGDPSLEAVVEYVRNGGTVSTDPNVDYLDVMGYDNAIKYYSDDLNKAFPLLRQNVEYQAQQYAKDHPDPLKKVAENFDSVFGDDAMNRYKKLAGQGIQALAGLMRKMDVFGNKQTDPMEQSIDTTGKIDLRDASISRDLWPYMIQSGLASQEQADAILAQEQAAQQPANVNTAQGDFNAQAAEPANGNLNMGQLIQAKSVFENQLAALDAQDAEEGELDEINQEIEKLENDRQYADDPTSYSNRLDSLYQQKAAIQGSANDKAARDAARIGIKAQIDNLNQGIDALRSKLAANNPAPANPANSNAEDNTAPKETSTQYTERLMSTHIDDMQEKYNTLNTLGIDAVSTYNDLTNEIEGYDNVIGGIPPETIEAAQLEHPEWVEAYAGKVQATLKRQKLVDQMKAQGIDITNRDQFDASMTRLDQETKDAAVLQYSTLKSSMTSDWTIYSQKGMTLKNADLDGFAFAKMATGSGTPDGIKNPATFAKDHYTEIGIALMGASEGGGNTASADLLMMQDMAFMTDDETETYSYLIANPMFGREKANLYYEGLKPYLKARQGKDISENLKDHPVLSTLYGGGLGFGSAMTGITQAVTKGAIPTTAGEYAGSYIRENMKQTGPKLPDWLGGASLGQVAYDAAYTTGNAVPSLIAEGIAPGSGPFVIAASAGGGAKRQALQEGHTQDEAFRKEILTGLSEGFMSKLLGTGAQGGRVVANAVGAKTANVMAGGFADFAGKLAGTMASNGTEEYLQDIVTPVIDKMAYGGEFKGINWTDPQALYDGLMGAFQAAVMDSPEIAKTILGTKAVGKNFTGPEAVSALVDAGLLAESGTQTRADAENARDNIDETQRLPGAYQTGKLAQSVLGNAKSGQAFLDFMNPKNMNVPEPSQAGDLTDEQIGEIQIPDENSPEMAPNSAPEANPAQQVEDYTLSPEEIGLADANAAQAAYDAVRDTKSYPPALARVTERMTSVKEMMNKTLEAQLEKLRAVSDLSAKNGEVLSGIANGTVSMDSGLKQVESNSKEIAQNQTDAESLRDKQVAMAAEWSEALAEHANAVGKYFRDVFEAETERQVAEAKKAGIERRNAQKAAELEEQDKQRAAVRIPEIDARTADLDQQDAALATNEAAAKKEAMSAIEAENKSYADNAAAEDKERAAQHARSASDNYAAIQRQRQKIAKEKQELAKERADISNKIGNASAPIKAEQMKPQESAVQAAPVAPAAVQAPVAETAPSPQTAPVAEPVKSELPAAPADKTTPDRVKALAAQNLPSQAINVSDIKVDPKTYQFKGGINENGVTTPLEGPYKPMYANDVLVHKRLDGSYYIADGHHRLDLAKRSGEQTINAIVLDEADGVTTADVRALAAARNLADGRGTALDAAKLFRESGMDASALKTVGLSKGEPVVDKGLALASLSDEYFNRVVSGDIDEYFGVLMGKHFPNDEQKQMAFMKQVGPMRNRLTHTVLEEYARLLEKGEVKEDESGQASFLPEYTSNTLAFARIVAAVKGKLANNKALFQKLSSAKKKAAIEAVGSNVLDSDANLTEAQKTKLAEYYMGNYMTGDLYKFINERATAVSDGKESAESAAKAVYDWVQKQAESGKVTIGGINSDANEATPEKDGGNGQKPKGKPEPEGTSELRSEASGEVLSLQPQVGQPVGQYTPKNKKIRRASAIAKDLYTAFNVKYTNKHQESQLLTRQTIALYERQPGIVVTHTFQNVRAYAHELGHHIFERAKVFDSKGNPTPEYKIAVDDMVKHLPAGFFSAYNPAALPREASAEFVRNYLLDRNAAVAITGEDFVKKFETEMMSPKELAAAQRARKEFRALLSAEKGEVMEARLATRRGPEKPDPAMTKLRNAVLGGVQAVADRYTRMLDFDIAANRAGVKNGPGNENNRSFVLFSNISRAFTQAGNIMERALVSPNGYVVGGSYFDVIKKHGITYENMKAFNKYLLAMHDIDRQIAGKPVFGDYGLMDVAQEAAKLESEHPEFIKAQQELVEWWNRFIDEWVVFPNAIENASDKIATFRRKYKNYVPTFRSMEDNMDTMVEEFGDMGGLLGQASVKFKAAKGSDRAVYMPVENFAIRIAEIVTSTRKVLAMRKLHEIYHEAEATQLGDWIRDVTANHRDENQEDLKILDANGNVHWYQVLDKGMYKALLGDTNHEDVALIRAVGKLTTAFKHVTTVSNPFFLFTNTPRDFVMGYVKGSNHNPFTYTAQWVKALTELLGDSAKGKLHRDSANVNAYMAMGGGDTTAAPRDSASVVQMERAIYTRYFRDSLKQMTSADTFRERVWGGENALRYLGAKINDTIKLMNNALEGTGRLAEFERTVRRTGSLDTAIYNSANVTTDFWRSGQSNAIHMAGKVYAFMNAGIQETYSWYKMAKEAQLGDGKSLAAKAGAKMAATAAKAIVMWALVPLAQHMLMAAIGGKTKEEYDLLAENVKSDNYLIPKFWLGDDAKDESRFIKIAKAKGVLPAMGDAVGRAWVEAIEKSGGTQAFNAYGVQDYIGSTVNGLFDNLNPFGSPIFAPALQIAMNRTWYGSPVESEYMKTENIAPANRINDRTSSAAILLSNLPILYNRVSPIQMDYFLNQSFGVVADYLTGDVGNAMLGRFTGREKDYKLGAETYTMIKKALTTDATAASDMTSNMYDMYDMVSGIVSDYGVSDSNTDKYRRLNPSLTDKERTSAVHAANTLIKKGGALYAAKTRTSKYYKDISAIEKGDKSDAEKELEIRKIKLKMLIENAEAVRAAEDFLRKYVKGTPTQYARIFGKK